MTVISAVALVFMYDLPMAILGAILFGIGNAVTTQLLQVMVIEWAGDKRRGVGMSTFSLFGEIGASTGGIVSGGISEHLGYTYSYLGSAAALGCAELANMFISRKSRYRER